MLLKNCRIIKDNKIIEGDILIDENGRIKKIAKDIKVDDEIIDIKNSLVIPGVIDAHVHFRWGEEKKEDFLSGSLAGINGGVCFAIDMPNNKPPITTKTSCTHGHFMSKDKKASLWHLMAYKGINSV